VPGDPHSLSDVDVRALHRARDGALWVSTNTAGLNRLDPRTRRFTRYAHDSADSASLSDPSVFGVAEDAQGQLWVGTQRGLNLLDPQRGTFKRFLHEPGREGSLANDWVYALHLGRSGTLWIGTVGGGIDRWDETRGRFLNLRPSALTGGSATLDDVFALHEGPDGRLWAGTRGGVVVIDAARRSARVLDLLDSSGAQPLVTAMQPDGAGRIWVATMQQGAIAIDLRTAAATRVPFETGRADGVAVHQPLLSIAAGPHHVFVGSWGAGVFRAPLEDPPFALLGQLGRGGLRNPNVTAVLGSTDAGRPWIGSFGGGPQRVDVRAGTAEPSPAPDDDRLPMSGVVSLARMQDGRLFAGATEGLFGFDARSESAVLDRHAPDRTEGIGSGYVAALLPWEGGALWVGVGGSGLYLRDAAGRYRSFRHDPAIPDSLSGDYVTALAAGTTGHVWVGTRSNGLNRCRIEPFSCRRNPGAGAGTPGDHHVTSLRRSRDGELLAAFDGGGVHRIKSPVPGSLDEDRIERWSMADGLLDDGVMAVEQDDDGTLWLSTRHGLARLDPRSGRVVNHVAESGLQATNFNTGASSSDESHLYFGSVTGLVSLPRGTPFVARPSTPIAITGAEILGARKKNDHPGTTLTDGFRARHGDGVAIEFAVLDFAETTHDYAYRMDPGAAWTPLGQRRNVTFLGLEPGQYHFEVRGRDVFGQWTVSRPLSFTIVPPLWMTLWFRTLAVLALVVLALALHRTRMRTLEARNAALENLKRQREVALERARASQRELEEAYAGLRQLTSRLESAKEDERARMSRELHDEFGQTLTAAKLTLQMLRQGTTDSAVGDGLAQSVAMVDSMIRQARDIARGLRPPLLDEAGLVPALQQFVQSAAGRSGVRVELQAGPGVEQTPPGLNTTVFRIVQEAVSNALRHSGARAIRVTMNHAAGRLTVVIEDDGVGFDPAAVEKRARRGEHLGLLGMTERVRNAGGTIEFQASEGGGSRIFVVLPCEPAADSLPREMETDR
jgi:signal transduction histidine kinase/ligand-binding sensor domain-containing protein